MSFLKYKIQLNNKFYNVLIKGFHLNSNGIRLFITVVAAEYH